MKIYRLLKSPKLNWVFTKKQMPCMESINWEKTNSSAQNWFYLANNLRLQKIYGYREPIKK